MGGEGNREADCTRLLFVGSDVEVFELVAKASLYPKAEQMRGRSTTVQTAMLIFGSLEHEIGGRLSKCELETLDKAYLVRSPRFHANLRV